jgi:septum site-determining protein MinC
MRQKTLRVFEVDNFENLKNIIDTKYELVKNHFFMLKEHNSEIEDYLKQKGLSFFVLNSEGFTSKEEKTVEIKVVEKEIIKETVKEINKKTEIYDRIIRSGEEIESDKNLIFLQRINAGAKIKSTGNIEIYNECDGLVDCEGDYLIVKKKPKGTILFKGEIIDDIDKLTIITENYKKVLE